jgi:hypothetical protein
VSAACTLACYDLGLEKVIGKQSIENWLEKKVSVRFTSQIQIVKRGKDGPTAYTYLITDPRPIYMHELFRWATRLLGDNAMFEKLAMAMNMKSEAQENLSALNLDKCRY